MDLIITALLEDALDSGVFIAAGCARAAENINNQRSLRQPIETSINPLESKEKRCVLPPHPENGGYVVVDEPDARPGDVFERVSLIQYIIGDNELVEIKNLNCAHGRWSLKIFKYESEKFFFNSSWCRLFQSNPLIDDLTVSVTERSQHIRVIDNYAPQTEQCTLPSRPADGTYTVVNKPGAKPGDVFDAVHLIYECDEKRKLIGNKNVYCFNNVWSSKAPICFECGVVHSIKGAYVGGVHSIKGAYVRGVHSIGHGYVGGVDVKIFELPWQVALYDKSFSPYKQICGGSIVASNLVITAAHCVWNDVDKLRPAQRFAVAAGSLYRAWNTPDVSVQKSDVSEIKIPPRFLGSQTNFQEDIALIFLSTPFKYNLYVRPVCLDFDQKFDAEQLRPGNFGKIAGWGLVSEDGKETRKLQTGWLPNVDINKCINDSASDFRVYITSDKICAGYADGRALCKGDSGGGIFFPENEKAPFVYYLRGVISLAPTNDKACNVHAVTSFTHILSHQYFIKENLDKALF